VGVHVEVSGERSIASQIAFGVADRSEQHGCCAIAAEMARIRVQMQKYRRAAEMVPGDVTRWTA
jgi:hypothetical protein